MPTPEAIGGPRHCLYYEHILQHNELLWFLLFATSEWLQIAKRT
jgi:hypothetical protein